MLITNTTRQTLSFPKTDGGTIDIPGGVTVTATGIDEDHASFIGAKVSDAITVGTASKKADAPAEKNRAPKPE